MLDPFHLFIGLSGIASIVFAGLVICKHSVIPGIWQAANGYVLVCIGGNQAIKFSTFDAWMCALATVALLMINVFITAFDLFEERKWKNGKKENA